MNILPIKTIKVDDFKGSVICMCYHCGGKFGSAQGKCAMFCGLCKTKEQRQAMDAENEEIWAKEGNAFECRYCAAEKIMKEGRGNE